MYTGKTIRVESSYYKVVNSQSMVSMHGIEFGDDTKKIYG